MADGDFLQLEDGSGNLLLESGDYLLLEELVIPTPELPVSGSIWFPSGTPFLGAAYELDYVVSWAPSDDDPDLLAVRFHTGQNAPVADEQLHVVQLSRTAFARAMQLVLPYVDRLSTYFDGVSEFGTMPDPGYLTGAFTVSVWCSTLTTGPAALMAGRSSALDLFIGIDDSRLTVRTSATNAQTAQNVGNFRDAKWHQLTLTRSAAGLLTIYVDAVSYPITVGSSSMPYSLLDPIGYYVARSRTGEYFEGLLDEASIWVADLNAAQVTELYNGGLPTDLREHSAAADLRAWLRFGEADETPVIHDVYGTMDVTTSGMDDSNFVTDVPLP